MEAFLIAAVIALFIVIAVAAYLAAARRRKELAAWAANRGLSFDPAHDAAMEHRLSEFDCLQQGRDRYAYNVISGQVAGRDFLAFDYHYVTGSGKNRQVHTFSAVAVASLVPLKPLLIRPEGFFDKVAEFLGADDIDFESAEFSRQFYVKSPDKKWAYDVLHAQAIEFLLAAPRFTIQFALMRVLVRSGKTFRVAEFEPASAVALGLLERLPRYLVEQQAGRG